MPDTLPPCPECQSPYAYENGELLMCPECGHEWNVGEPDENALIVKDALMQICLPICSLPVPG
jgi:protein PhnA